MSRGMGCAAAIAAAIAMALAGHHSALAQGAFYQASPVELAGQPGSLIRREAMSGAPAGASAYRVLYRSTGLKGEPIAVSGVVIVPAGEAPTGGRPVVAWAHPTSGIIPRCAPSLAHFIFLQIQGAKDILERGYIIAATDYPGLGTPGPHPYLVGASEGRAVLDAVRAVRNMDGAEASNKTVLWGHSQGGQAVLYGGLLAKAYAPELSISGIAAAAPATELGTLIANDLPTPGGKNLLAMTLWSWSRVFGLSLDGIVEPGAMAEVDRLASDCLESPIDVYPREEVGKALQKQFLAVDNLLTIQPWSTLLQENTVGVLPPEIPIFLAQGTADDTITPSVTASYKGKLCNAGSKVEYVTLPGVGHGLAARDSAQAAVAWMSDRFAGGTPPDDCNS